jgi:hypothetical protein
MGTCRSTGRVSSLRNGRMGVIAAVLLAVLLPLAAGGCYGGFPLTHKIYDFNGEVSDNKAVQTLTFWAFAIFPVYEIGMLADAFVLNPIEFWTGEKVLSVGPTTDSNGNTVCLTPSPDGREAVLTVSRNGKVLTQEFFVKVSDTSFEVRDSWGTLQGKVLKSADGTISLTDPNGTVVRTLPAGALTAM